VVREGEGERGGDIAVSEELWFGGELFRPANNLVTRNDAKFISIRHSDRNVVSDNDVAAISVSGTLLGTPGENGVDENVIVRNRVANAGAAWGIQIGQSCHRNVVEDNDVSGAYVGIQIALDCSDNVLRGNHMRDAVTHGIVVGNSPYALGANLVEDNVTRDGGQDGILVEETANGTVLRGNVAFRNGDDGLDVRSAATSVADNRAHHNADWGIVAVPGVFDAGGNRAWGNGQPAQCLNVTCGPPGQEALRP
jgi:parallel beta-helix repeat protein